MALADDYVGAVWDDLKEDAAWLPQTTFALGDYGIWSGNVFIRSGHVSELAGATGPLTDLTENEEPSAQSFYSSSDVTTVTFDAAGNVSWPAGSATTVATGGASVQVTFSKQNTVWANFGNARVVELRNKTALMEELRRRANLSSSDPQWWNHASYRVVTQILRVDRMTIALSRSNNAGLLLEANASGADWGSANVAVRISHQSGALATWDGASVAGKVYTPFFRTSHVVYSPISNKWVDDDGPRD